MGGIHIHITVMDANGQNASVALTDEFVPGQSIPEKVVVAAAEAAGMANTALAVQGTDPVLHRDKRRNRNARG